MKKSKLIKKLSYFVKNEESIGVSIYVLLKNSESPQKLDISAEALPKLKSLFVNSISEALSPEELSVMPLSASDERKNVIYEYDLEIPDELELLEEVVTTDDLETFDASSNNVTSIKALIIEIGDEKKQVVLYKTMPPVTLYSRASFFLIKQDQRFEEITDEFIRISPSFQILRTGKSLFVLDLKTIERMFGFHDAIKKEAKLGISAIEKSSILANPEALTEMLEDIAFARKLTKIAQHSPVLNLGINTEVIIDFCKTFPSLKKKIRFNDEGDKIQLHTKKSKNLFIKLLMDDFLTSELTEHHYTSLAKDEATD